MRKIVCFVLCGIGLLIVSGVLVYPLKNCRPPNVILITIDTLRADHLGFHGYPRGTSPELDYFSKKNLLCSDVTVQSSKTLPSIATLFTSRFGHEIAVMTNLHRLKDCELTLPEVFKYNGYQTRGFSSNGNLAPKMGVAQGFDDFQFIPKPRTADKLTDIYFRSAYNKIKEPFFHWIHYLDPHGPYTPPSPYDSLFIADVFYNASKSVTLDYHPMQAFNKNYVLGAVPHYQQKHFKGNPRQKEYDFYVARYDGEIRFMDKYVGELLRMIKKQKLLNSPLFLITSDHGEGMGEHDYYFEHGWFVYQDQVHVPLLLSISDNCNSSGIIDMRPLSAIDIAPTILTLSHIEVPESFRGTDLSSKDQQSTQSFIYSRNCESYPRNIAMIRQDPWKFVIDDTGKMELYHLQNDPLELTNLADDKPTVTAEFLNRYHQGPWLENPVRPPEVVPKFTMNEGVKTHLKSLGYVEN